MPLYEYKCDRCGQVFEVRQKFSEEPLTVHEDCGGAVHRLLSAPALQFKGTGWYVTDYGHGNGSGEKKSTESKPADSSSSGSTEKKSSSTPTTSSTESKS